MIKTDTILNDIQYKRGTLYERKCSLYNDTNEMQIDALHGNK